MSISDMMVMVLSAKTDEPALAAAETLQTRFDDPHLSVKAFLRRAERPELVSAGAGAAWVSYPVPAAEAHDSVRHETMLLSRRLRGVHGKPALKVVECGGGAEAELAGPSARCAGMTIMMRPFGIGQEPVRRAMFENVLYESGRPLMLVPPKRRDATLGRVILIAWDGSREAARAMADARPLLEKAETVYVFTVDVEGREGPSAMEAGAHLRRTGLRCHQRAVRGERHEVESLLLGECAALEVDLLVMGGYGHARLHEMLFGGVTRTLVRSSPVPLFMSR